MSINPLPKSNAPVWVPFVCSKCGKKHYMTEATHAEIGSKPCRCGGTWTAPQVPVPTVKH